MTLDDPDFELILVLVLLLASSCLLKTGSKNAGTGSELVVNRFEQTGSRTGLEPVQATSRTGLTG